jgi:signal transduction histidine kinase
VFKKLIVILLLFTQVLCAQKSAVQQLRRQLAKEQDSIVYTNVLNELGMKWHLINADSCFWFAVQARDVANRLNYRKGIADALNNLSIAYALKANIKQAIEYEGKALVYYRQLEDNSNICQVTMNMSVFHTLAGMNETGEQYLYQAMDLGKKLVYDSIYSLVLINYALRFNADSTKRDSVQWAIQKAKQIASHYPGCSRDLYYIHAFEADNLFRKGEPGKAVAWINSLATQAQKDGLIYVAIDILQHIENYYNQGYQLDVIPYKEKMYALGKIAGYTDLMLPQVISLYRYYTRVRNAAKMAEYGHELWTLTDRQELMKDSRHVNYLDYFLKEQELNEWHLSNKVQTEKLARANTQRLARRKLIAFLFALLMLLGGFTFSRYRSYQYLRQQEELLANMNAAISDKNRQLQVQDDFKNKLISVVAHDFREPLQNIIRVSALFRNGDADPALRQKLIKDTEHSSRKTLEIFDNILRWIKSQLSGFVYAPAPCNLKDMFSGVIAEIPEGLQVAGDQAMLQFVHRSLLQGATTLGKDVRVVAEQEAERVKVMVISSPTVLTAQQAANLFAYEDAVYSVQGEGEELAMRFIICKDFMDKMGGQIWANVTGEQLQLMYALPSFS